MSTTAQRDAALAQAFIAGAYERPVALRQSGSMGGPAYGSLNPLAGPPTMDATTMAAQTDEAARWNAWELGYADSSRQAATHARIAFVILLTGVSAWLGLQLLSMPA